MSRSDRGGRDRGDRGDRERLDVEGVQASVAPLGASDGTDGTDHGVDEVDDGEDGVDDDDDLDFDRVRISDTARATGDASDDDDDDGDAAGDDFAPDELAMLHEFFRDEAHVALEGLTSTILGAGAETPGADALAEMMRTTHTLKGSAGTVGLPAIVDFCHRLEDQLGRLRDGRLAWSAVVLDQFVEVVDALRGYVDAIGAPTSEPLARARVSEHLETLRQLGRDSVVVTRIEAATGDLQTSRRVDPPLDSAAVASRDAQGETDRQDRTTASSDTDAVPRTVSGAAERHAIYTASPAASGARGAEPSELDSRREAEPTAARAQPTPSPPRARPQPDGGDGDDGVVTAHTHAEDETTRSIVAGVARGPHAVRPELTGAGDSVPAEDYRRDGRGLLRVDPTRIDTLMDSVGELVFDRTRIERRVKVLHGLTQDLGRARQTLRDQIGRVRDADTADEHHQIASALAAIEEELAEGVTQLARATTSLLDDAEALRRTSASLQTGLTRVRMLSAGTLFSRLARPLRAIARRAGKRVELVSTGADTEFDKTVAEQITDPLIQLLRNAVAHGIEPSEQRLARGKSATGEIRIDARQEGGLVVLDVSDDGAGIDPTALRRRFVDSGRWTRSRAALTSDEDVLRAIFDAGVSTRDEADHLAGRGVGLDAVRDTIARLGGEIRMTSTIGKGTRFTMRLPVSTAVSHALLFKVVGNVFAVPNVHVVETAQVERDDHGVPPTFIEVRGDRMPLVSLQSVLGGGTSGDRTGAPNDGAAWPAVIIEYAGKRLAFTCDKLVGPREIFVKALGPLLSPLPLYAGATISGSGKVQLILDPASLVRLAYPDSQPVPTAETQEVSSSYALTGVRGRALIADDSRAVREATTRILSGAGYIVDSAEDGEHAWDLVREHRYDVLVTDLEMPRLDGFSLIERIRGDDRLASLPVLVVSSRASRTERQRARQLRVRRFVQKPVTRQKILDALDAL